MNWDSLLSSPKQIWHLDSGMFSLTKMTTWAFWTSETLLRRASPQALLNAWWAGGPKPLFPPRSTSWSLQPWNTQNARNNARRISDSKSSNATTTGKTSNLSKWEPQSECNPSTTRSGKRPPPPRDSEAEHMTWLRVMEETTDETGSSCDQLIVIPHPTPARLFTARPLPLPTSPIPHAHAAVRKTLTALLTPLQLSQQTFWAAQKNHTPGPTCVYQRTSFYIWV